MEDKDYPFVYSNFGIAVVGLVLEKIYNDDFTALMNEYIKSELSLSRTEVAKQRGNLSGYWDWAKGDGYIPAGAIVSDISDMAQYLKIYMTDRLSYAADTYTAIKHSGTANATYEKMNIHMDMVGMTWMTDEKNGIVWHNGGTGEFNSYIGFTKDKKHGVVILSNLSPDQRISMTVIGAKLLTEKTGLPR